MLGAGLAGLHSLYSAYPEGMLSQMLLSLSARHRREAGQMAGLQVKEEGEEGEEGGLLQDSQEISSTQGQ